VTAQPLPDPENAIGGRRPNRRVAPSRRPVAPRKSAPTSTPPPAPASTAAPANDRLLSIDEVGVLIGSRRLAERLIEERRIDYVKLGSGRTAPVRIRESVLNAYIEAHTVRAVGA
jgi:hypothetical protein